MESGPGLLVPPSPLLEPQEKSSPVAMAASVWCLAAATALTRRPASPAVTWRGRMTATWPLGGTTEPEGESQEMEHETVRIPLRNMRGHTTGERRTVCASCECLVAPQRRACSGCWERATSSSMFFMI